MTHACDENVSYDKNGNITHLDRNGVIDDPSIVMQMDDLTYTFDGNKLRRINDGANWYELRGTINNVEGVYQ